ncbi:MAG TPA: C10 family peptidase [Bacteroidia bacterium]|nr:C10 family peptidase [Bacteroidia bacterium]
MKKFCYAAFFLLGTHFAQAKPITPGMAQTVAENFYKQHSVKAVSSVNLTYMGFSKNGAAAYYAFNINTDDGFVIITADDALLPIIGYSTEKQFVIPGKNTNIAYWLNKRTDEIYQATLQGVQANQVVSNEWNKYINPTNAKLNTQPITINSASVTPLVQTTWDQAPFYNDSCPSGSVTGCVATCMAQIMRYWNYPSQGKDSSSYCDCTANGFTNNFGTLHANYGATTYNWAAMPLSVASTNTAVAQLMYHCGVSVHMDYDPNGSGAEVIIPESIFCSQTALPKYFNYDPYTIKGLLKNNFTDTAWMQFILTDLYAGRPIEYAGGDHCWVLDGYDGSGNVHMNWGWSGQNNGFYPLSNLNLGGGGSYDFTQGQEAVFGIQPLAVLPVDAGVRSINAPASITCATSINPIITLFNFGSDTLKTCHINYKIDANTVQTIHWSGMLVSAQSNTLALGSMAVGSGTHTLTCYTSKPDSTTDGDTLNDRSVITFYTSAIGQALPLSQGFETSNNLPTGWALNNSLNYGNWMVSNRAAKTGINSIAYDNAEGNGDGNMTGQAGRFYIPGYDFTNASAEILTFDVAYAPATRPDSSTARNDTLAVYYSSDCGTTWHNLYKKGGSVLATAPIYQRTSHNITEWVPTSTQWRHETINLSALSGMPDVMFAFENRSDWGNWLFVDNINIYTTVGISTIEMSTGLYAYPNPAHNYISVTVFENTSSISVTDVIGQTVIAEQRVNGAQQVQAIDIANLANGVYFMKVTSNDNQTKIIKFIKD